MKHSLPLLSTARVVPSSGGLASYSPDYNAQWSDTADYIDKIFKGSKPADLPVAFPTKFEVTHQLNTAKALGLTVPPLRACPRRRGDRVMSATSMPDRLMSAFVGKADIAQQDRNAKTRQLLPLSVWRRRAQPTGCVPSDVLRPDRNRQRICRDRLATGHLPASRDTGQTSLGWTVPNAGVYGKFKFVWQLVF